MENEIDYTKHTEPELVEMFGRMDPRYAPANTARLNVKNACQEVAARDLR